MKPGIYTELPEEEYHAIDALGSTGIKDLVDDPTEFQYMRMHPEEEVESAAKTLGSAIHARLLEGQDAFEGQYYTAMDKDAAIAAGALSTGDDMKVWLRNNGEKVSAKNKQELIDRILEADPNVMILDNMIKEHAELNAGKDRLTQKQWDKVVSAARWCQMDPTLKEFMDNGTFNVGMPEVSVIAEHDGVPVKARFDRLIHHAVIDLKSFSPFLNKDPVMAIPYTIKKLRYDIQAGHYTNMWHKAKELWNAGQVFGDYPDGFFERVFAREHPLWIWLFIKTTGAPQPYVRGFSPDSTALAYARENAREAIIFYQQKVERFGRDNDWPPENRIIELGDEELMRS